MHLTKDGGKNFCGNKGLILLLWIKRSLDFNKIIANFFTFRGRVNVILHIILSLPWLPFDFMPSSTAAKNKTYFKNIVGKSS